MPIWYLTEIPRLVNRSSDLARIHWRRSGATRAHEVLIFGLLSTILALWIVAIVNGVYTNRRDWGARARFSYSEESTPSMYLATVAMLRKTCVSMTALKGDNRRKGGFE